MSVIVSLPLFALALVPKAEHGEPRTWVLSNGTPNPFPDCLRVDQCPNEPTNCNEVVEGLRTCAETCNAAEVLQILEHAPVRCPPPDCTQNCTAPPTTCSSLETMLGPNGCGKDCTAMDILKIAQLTPWASQCPFTPACISDCDLENPPTDCSSLQTALGGCAADCTFREMEKVFQLLDRDGFHAVECPLTWPAQPPSPSRGSA
jgi:hypothetical protein